ncbi:type VII secretion system-associated protein [Streptomyces sp. NPDC004629]|uniref:type VII secretion system-associated protein n=1 Tax=Streptomyces sp. NPDC004629 TaxID=3364705 RepID=UPI0036B33DB0
MADLSHLDKTSLQSFIDGDLATFIGDLKQILEGDPSMRDMADGITTEETVGAISAGKPIMMGLIDADDLTSGSSFADALATNIETVVNVLLGQQDTFDEIDDALRTTVKELFKAQGDNLGKIGADKFSEILSETGFSGESGSGDHGDSSGDKDGDKGSKGGGK